MIIKLQQRKNNSQPTQFSSVVQSCPTLCDPMDCSTPGFPVHHHLPELAQIHVHWVANAIQPSYPLLSSSPLPSIFPSIRVFSHEPVLCIKWPKYWISASASVLPMNTQEWFPLPLTDLTSLQSSLKSLLQHHSSKAPILLHSAFFMVQLSHPYTTTRCYIRVNYFREKTKLKQSVLIAQLVIVYLSQCVMFQGVKSKI